MEDQSQLNVPGLQAAPQFVPPAENALPDNAFGKMVREGHALFVDTRRLMPEAVGNGMNCSNCHLDQGRLAHSAPMWGAYPMYPAYRKKNDKVNTYAERIQGCFQFSMNGKPPAADSPQMTALATYAYWLSTKAQRGWKLPGGVTRKYRSPRAAMTSNVASRCTASNARSAMATTVKGRKWPVST